jgi:hypothetical protein
MSSLLQRIDRLLLPDHICLDDGDQCFFLREYTAGGGWQASETNQLILNLKKDPVRFVGTPAWRYKGLAIDQCAAELRAALSKYLDGWTVVPIPPSQAKNTGEYDDRLSQVGRKLCLGTKARFAELIIQKASTSPHHQPDAGPRRPELIAANYAIDESIDSPDPTRIWVIDDVLTTGAHYKAAQRVLLGRFPNAQVYGVFIARRVPSPDSP